MVDIAKCSHKVQAEAGIRPPPKLGIICSYSSINKQPGVIMRIEASFHEVKLYTEKLLAIQNFKSEQEKLNYQRKLAQIKERLVGVSNEVQMLGYHAEIYFIEDIEQMIEKMEVFHLIKEVNQRLTSLTH